MPPYRAPSSVAHVSAHAAATAPAKAREALGHRRDNHAVSAATAPLASTWRPVRPFRSWREPGRRVRKVAEAKKVRRIADHRRPPAWKTAVPMPVATKGPVPRRALIPRARAATAPERRSPVRQDPLGFQGILTGWAT